MLKNIKLCHKIIIIFINTTFSSKVRSRHELWTVSGDLSLEIELIDHQNETKVDQCLQLWKFQLYNYYYNKVSL